MNNISIEVKMSPGTCIEDAAKEACDLATKVGVSIEFKFNDVLCVAQPNGNVSELVGKYYLVMAGS